MERWFPARHVVSKISAIAKPDRATSEHKNQADFAAKRKFWAFELTRAAKDDLFNMFHNKSDDFLNAVAKGELEIVGPLGFKKFRPM